MPDLAASARQARTSALACKSCHTFIASRSCLLSNSFRGHAGKAALFTDASNILLDPPCMLLMDTGAHTIQEFCCKTCQSYLGWKIIHAHERTEKWKEGRCLLELELLEDTPDVPLPPYSAGPLRPPSTAAHVAARWDAPTKRVTSAQPSPRAAPTSRSSPRTGSLLVPSSNVSPAQVVPGVRRTGSLRTPTMRHSTLAPPPPRPLGPRAGSSVPALAQRKTLMVHQQMSTSHLPGYI
ncbi:hypothetical protein B0H21DRAFT_821390 [Amylocystis lapponica]|nr:hypothetical protein B0H21DRAFT_821390 [Amylocystis lapponica]